VFVDVAKQRERIQIDKNTIAIALFKTNTTYLLSTTGTRTACYYYPSTGAVNGSLSFPTVVSFATIDVVTVDGRSCERSIGMACVQINGEPVDPSKVTLWAQQGNAVGHRCLMPH
jgi:hypothetical protein